MARGAKRITGDDNGRNAGDDADRAHDEGAGLHLPPSGSSRRARIFKSCCRSGMPQFDLWVGGKDTDEVWERRPLPESQDGEIELRQLFGL
jgi:hypothetical protein